MKPLDLISWVWSPKNDIAQTPAPQITTNSSTWGAWFEGIPGLPAVTEKTVLSISAAYACTNLIAGAISAIPMHLYRQTPQGEREQLYSEDLWWLLNEQFSPRWSAAVGWEYLVTSLLFHGDFFAVIIRQGAKIVGLEPIHPSAVQVLATPDRMRLVYAVTRERGQVQVFDQDDMLHVAGFGFDGFRGVSTLRHVLATPAGVSLAMQEFAGKFFANSARPDVVITTDQAVTKEQAEAIKARWQEHFQGYANAHQPVVLGQGAKVAPLTMSAEDTQMLATRQFSVEEIARAFGVPPFMIGHVQNTTSWGSGVETMGKGFVRFTLRRHLHKIQTEINRKFFRTSGKIAEFDTFELESADMKTLFESFRVAVGRAGEPGFMSTDEVRRRLNLKKTPGGDALSSGNTNEPQPNAAAAGA